MTIANEVVIEPPSCRRVARIGPQTPRSTKWRRFPEVSRVGVGSTSDSLSTFPRNQTVSAISKRLHRHRTHHV
jgi:hypothetical protein